MQDASEIKRSLVPSVHHILSGYIGGGVGRGCFLWCKVFDTFYLFMQGALEVSEFPLAVCQVGLKAYRSRKIRMP